MYVKMNITTVGGEVRVSTMFSVIEHIVYNMYERENNGIRPYTQSARQLPTITNAYCRSSSIRAYELDTIIPNVHRQLR